MQGASETVDRARQLEANGEALAARVLLQREARDSRDPASIAAYAEFLDRYNDPETRSNYEKLLSVLSSSPDDARRAAVARRLVLLDLLEGDREAAARHLQIYRAAGGRDWDGAIPAAPAPAGEARTASIPGPLRSFMRMAAVSADVGPADLLSALARNVVTNGYQASANGESLEPSEYMKLLTRYVSQARELSALAGPEKTIRIDVCESPKTGELLRVLGYRMRGACGGDLVLETVNASRAFLTIDSGFPLAQLEQALRTSRPFSYNYAESNVAVLYGADYWLAGQKEENVEFIDVFLSDPSLCRLYLGMSKLDRETADALREAVPVQKLRPYAHVLDFFGGMFEIRGGKAVVPGGPRAEQTWADLAGAPPSQGARFFERLLIRDDGWLASLYDALSRVNGPEKDYLTEPARLKRYYEAIRGRVTSPGPARPVFRSNTDMMLLTTRLRVEPDGRPHIPGGLEVWKRLFMDYPNGKLDGKLARAARDWKEPDDVIEALFGLCRKAVENEPLKMFLAISDLNRGRAKPLEPATVERLARDYRQFSAQYSILSECPSLSDAAIAKYLDTAKAISNIGRQDRRANAAGTVQALVGLWQILFRQGSVPPQEADGAFLAVLSGFEKVREDEDLFEAGRAGVRALLKAAGASGGRPQDRMVEMLAGTAHPKDAEAHRRIEEEMIRILEAQRLVSLNTLFEFADNLDAVGQGKKPDTRLLNRLAARISEIELPRSSLSAVEKNALSFGYWTDRHVDRQRKLNLRSALAKAGSDVEKLRELRGELAPFLRDTLVGLNYAHYAPPGAQILITNPLFVRSHDFIGLQNSNQTWRYCELLGTGWPSSAGGRLVGSLSGLPYALAEAEQNFLIPEREQALIWGDLVPQMILSAKIPRWWNATPAQMHLVGLHMRYGASLLAEAAVDSKMRQAVSESLSKQAAPGRERRVMELLAAGDVPAALDNVTPVELFRLAADALTREPKDGGLFASEIRRLQGAHPDTVSYEAISRAFGTPKPTLTNSYRPELLFLRTFPTLMGYSSRIMAESWESNILYYAALADEVHVPPSQLNVLIPEWTQKTVESIFATHLEDWPALLRSLRRVGEDVRLKMRIQMDTDQKASLE